MPLPQYIAQLTIHKRLFFFFTLLIVVSQALCGTSIYFLTKRAILESINQELNNTTTTIVNMVKGSIDVSVRNYLRAVAEKNLEIVSKIQQEHLDSGSSEAEAKQRARDILLSQTIGKTGYLYCMDSRGTIIIHPNAELVGKSIMSNLFAREQINKKSGYLEYDWANPGESVQRPKALFMTYFEPWDWIISASSYREEFDTLVSVEDFRQPVSNIRLGKSGYIFILDKNGKLILHPWATGYLGNYEADLESKFLPALHEHTRGRIDYRWRDPDTNRMRDKTAIFEHLPELGWIVVASIYSDEIRQPLDHIIFIVLFATALSILFSLPLAMMLGSSITRPIDHLVTLFHHAAKGNLETRSDNTAPDEIGILARRFNLFMEQLQQTNTELVEQVEISRRTDNLRRLFEEIFINALEGIAITDTEGIITTINPAFTAITGYEQHEVIGKTTRVLKSDRHHPSFYEEMWAGLLRDGYWAGEIWNRRKSGELYPELLSITAIKDSDGNTMHYAAVFHDITDMKEKEEQLLHQATHDTLTGLPNRTLLLDRISTAISSNQRSGGKFALFFIDLDNFKHINDSLGHAQGDMLLKEATARIKKVFRAQDTISRLGGDEFVIMIQGVTDEHHLSIQAKRLLTAFSAPFQIAGKELYVTASIGITLYPDDGDTPGTLIKNADMAMYQAKSAGKNSYNMFRQEMQNRVQRRLQLESALRQAVRNEEFVVYYQPKVDLKTRTFSGLEALVRWMRPDGEIISPDEFIPLAEETGLILSIGRMVMERAFLDQQFIHEHTGRDLVVSVNLSARQFMDSDLSGMIRKVLKATNADPTRLEFEITESVIMKDVQATVATLEEIAAMGFALSVDDFGTGYSSLSYLKSFPIDTLKVDRSFVMDITDDQEDALIVQTIINMGRSLGLDVIAEGVETEAQADMLEEFGCAKVQGYLFGKPMPIMELLAHLGKKLTSNN